ncbi:hypothetical protein PAXRUDRAFT_828183 [Paxillus rubicundulus Ve08.2h10]|uniref:Uncharacterized protein n=1 Tax=Paxillus rubicundulus Ve08.2h10 TaxID=930991 RepID=A0A0D0DWG9_9AGAM|nr:hypothetical protein PAXRUDRAFT_828183 [Paxillus rubicundulus Ve08.2h10]
MSTRQAFIPQRPQSVVNTTASSEPHPSPGINALNPLNTSASTGPSKNFDRPRTSLDADPRDSLRNAGGKARSLAAFLGRNKGTLSPVAQVDGLGPAEGQMQLHRRSFDGIRKPIMAPLSIIPYPTPQPNAIGQGTYAFPRPSTPLSASAVLNKGLGSYEDGRNNEGNEDGILFMGPGAEAEPRVDTGGGVTGYMRVFSRSGSGGTGMGTGRIGQQTSGLKIAAPVPGYTQAGLGMRTGVQGDDEAHIDRMYARQSRSLEAITEEVDRDEMERTTEPARSLWGVKRGISREEMERDGGSVGGDDQAQGSAKRLRRTQDEDEVRQVTLSGRLVQRVCCPCDLFVDSRNTLVCQALRFHQLLRCPRHLFAISRIPL